MKVEGVIEKFIEIRDKRAVLKRAYEAEDFILKQAAEKVEGWLLNRMISENVEAIKTSIGTAYISQETKASCADWPGMWEWMAENKRFSMLEKRVSIGGIKEYEEEKGELPPFVNKTVERVVRVRRS